MIDLGDRRLFDDGTVILSANAALEVLYAGRTLEGAWFDPCEDVTLHNDSNRMLDAGLTQLRAATGPMHAGKNWYHQWLTPEPWSNMDVLSWCVERCSNDAEIERVCEEYKLFEARDMIPVLRHLMFMVHELRARGVVWGVGRGSSVSSFVLYLIGINRINPLEYDLDISEFLK